ncbi:MAG: HAD family hydrolase, partial [Candidatus Thorarchaeota archaeon]
MPASRIIEAVLFDVDGVVVESELLHMQTFNELLKPLGITISKKVWKSRFLGAGSAAIMSTLFKEHSIDEDPAPWIENRRRLYQQRVARGDLHAIPGFHSFYQSIQDILLPTAFVSMGHPANLSLALKSLDLQGKHPVIDVTQVTRTKPDPEPYLLGAQTLAVTPVNCVVFEDSPIGITAAKAANMRCVALKTTNPQKDLTAADLIISNFKEWTI